MSFVLFKFLVRCHKIANELNNFKELGGFILQRLSVLRTYYAMWCAMWVSMFRRGILSLFDITDSSVIFSETMIPICKPSSAMPVTAHKTTI